jgi:hypothetical protein
MQGAALDASKDRATVAALVKQSRWLQRRTQAPRLDLESNPFCENKQVLDWHETHGSAAVKEAGRRPRKKLATRNALRDILTSTLEDLAAQAGAKRVSFSYPHRRRAASPKPRPKSPVRGPHMDVLTLIGEEADRELARLSGSSSAKALPRAGLLSADDMYRLVHAPPPAQAAAMQPSAAVSTAVAASSLAKARVGREPARGEEEREAWDDRVYDGERERRRRVGKERQHKVEVNAVPEANARKEPDASLREHLARMSRMAVTDRPQPFCSDRQLMDELELRHLNTLPFHKEAAILERTLLR